ncbi:MAG: protein jag [Chloroflexi bacterium]|nr:protein jag [Chloroflexota bacterium]
MSQNKREIEATGPDVEAAIESGLARLGVSRSDVIIEVVDEGSRGLLGIGSRDAVVRLTAMTLPPTPPAPPEPKPAKPVAAVETAVPAPIPTPDEDETDEEVEYETFSEEEVVPELVREMLDKMGIDATVSTSQTEPDDLTDKRMTVVEINGDDLGALIGPRGETLNAIQYVTRLMAGHKMRRRADFVIDVQGYRQRREQALSRMAERMGQKVAARHRPMTLEPMPPNERRIIHMTLRDNEDVYTESTGEGKRRKVQILPKT